MTNCVSFGDFVLNMDTRELRREHGVVPLSPKAYQLLELLVVSRPKAISKIALQEHLWPSTYVVEKNLVNLIAEIRHALGDDPTHARFVRTVHRFGYAFRESTDASPTSDAAPHASDVRFRLLWPEGRAALRDGDHVLGRDPGLDVFLDSPGVSRRHALIRIDGNRATLEDLGSKNGTYLSDGRLNSCTPLGDGDVIRVGSVQLTFRAVRTRGSTRTEPRAAI